MSLFGRYGVVGGVVFGLGIMVIGAIAVISCFAVAEGIKVILDIEENTRKVAEDIKI